MIDARELRIGNWLDISDCSVIWNNLGDGRVEKIVRSEFGQVNTIVHGSHGYIVAGGFHCKEHGKYIPLDPSILEQCGFEKYDDFDYIIKTGKSTILIHDMSKINKTMEVYYHLFNGEDYFITDIHYLHQLQNLIYALCGQELNYQPK